MGKDAETKRREDEEQALEFVTRVARSLGRRLGSEITLDDRIAFGMIGYLEARTRHDSTRDAFPGALAWARTRGAMLDGARRWTQRQSVAALGARRRRRALAAGESPPSRSAREVLSLDGASGKACALVSRVATGRRTWTADRLKRAICDLPTRERVIVGMHYGQARTIREIADELGADRSWISRLHARAIGRLKRRVV